MWLSKGCNSHVRPPGTKTTWSPKIPKCLRVLSVVCTGAQSMHTMISACGFRVLTALRIAVNIGLMFSAETHPFVPFTHRIGDSTVAKISFSRFVIVSSLVKTNCGIYCCSSGTFTMQPNTVAIPRLSFSGIFAVNWVLFAAPVCITYPLLGCICLYTGVSSRFTTTMSLPARGPVHSHLTHLKKAETFNFGTKSGPTLGYQIWARFGDQIWAPR